MAEAPGLGARERAYVYSVAMKYVKDEEAAEDVTQEALLLAHRHRDSFQGASRFTTWLYRIAATTSLMHLRKRRRRGREVPWPTAPARSDDTELAFDPADPGPTPEQRAGSRERLRRTLALLETLGPPYREVVRLRFLAGFTEPEIAAMTGLNLSTVKSRSYRARRKLRETA